MKVLILLFSISVAEFVNPLDAYGFVTYGKRSGSKIIGMSQSVFRLCRDMFL